MVAVACGCKTRRELKADFMYSRTLKEIIAVSIIFISSTNSVKSVRTTNNVVTIDKQLQRIKAR